jgi:hypothetical protein
MQSTPGWIRRLVSHRYYHDIDIRNCCPELSLQVFEHSEPGCFPQLTAYVADRAGTFTRLRAKYVELEPLSDTEMKKLFLSGFHWGDYPKSDLMKRIPELAQWVRTFS